MALAAPQPAQPDTQPRAQWSRIGFVLAASGSAIGLGNVVFFPANAYRYGGGAFYLPYFVALLSVGLPLMALELALGQQQRRAFPVALRRVAGRRGELLGWWALANTSLITLYYVAILGWVVGMMVGAIGPLWRPETATPGFAAASQANPGGFFFQMLSGYRPLAFVALVWVANAFIVRRGTASIERAVKLFVPLMWVLMLVLLVRGVTLPGGPDGVWALFTPDLEAMRDVTVWQGAFSQIFFTLSIGFGVMTAYGSYLPRDSDQTNNSLLISCMNCGFEYVAGVAIFAILFAFAAVPSASTISMTFFIVPQGIARLPGGATVVSGFGLLFFVLLLLAGLSSSVSMVESLVAALLDKFSLRRGRTVLALCIAGALGSSVFVLPQIVDPGLGSGGTLGLTLLDLVDHWAFNYGLLVVGISQCLLLGRLGRITRIRAGINRHAAWPLGRWYDHLIGRVIPAVLAGILLWSVAQEVRAGLYGSGYAASFAPSWKWLGTAPLAALGLWLLLPAALALLLTRLPGKEDACDG